MKYSDKGTEKKGANSRRLKDIELTKKSIGYYRYSKIFSREKRRRSLSETWCPETPNPEEGLSCSLWSKKLKHWRKSIHRWTNLNENSFQKLLEEPDLKITEIKLSQKEFLKKDLHIKTELENSNNLNSAKPLEINNQTASKNGQIEILRRIILSDPLQDPMIDILENLTAQSPTFFIPKHYNSTTTLEKFYTISEDDLEQRINNLNSSGKIYSHWKLLGLNLYKHLLNNNLKEDTEIKDLVETSKPNLELSYFEALEEWHTSLRLKQLMSIGKIPRTLPIRGTPIFSTNSSKDLRCL